MPSNNMTETLHLGSSKLSGGDPQDWYEICSRSKNVVPKNTIRLRAAVLENVRIGVTDILKITFST